MTENDWKLVMNQFGRIDVLSRLMGEILVRMPDQGSAAFQATHDFFEYMIGEPGFTGDIAHRNQGAAELLDELRSRLAHEQSVPSG